jgi:hypothetical protein
MALFSDQELAEMRARYQSQQREKYLREDGERTADIAMQSGKPSGLDTRTPAEILIEFCRADPAYTARELAEASGHSASWVRKTLKKAGIALPARQKKAGRL